MKIKLIAAVATAAFLTACTDPGPTTITHVDEFTGTKTEMVRNCHDSTNSFSDDELCIMFSRDVSNDVAVVSFTYHSDSWIFMHSIDAKIMDTGETFKLARVNHFDVDRKVYDFGGIRETIHFDYKLSTMKNNTSPLVRFFKATKKNPNSKVMFQVSGKEGYVNF